MNGQEANNRTQIQLNNLINNAVLNAVSRRKGIPNSAELGSVRGGHSGIKIKHSFTLGMVMQDARKSL